MYEPISDQEYEESCKLLKIKFKIPDDKDDEVHNNPDVNARKARKKLRDFSGENTKDISLPMALSLIRTVFESVNHAELRDVAYDLGPPHLTDKQFEDFCRIDCGVAGVIVSRFYAQRHYIECFCRHLPKLLMKTFSSEHPATHVMHNMRATILKYLPDHHHDNYDKNDNTRPDWYYDTLAIFSAERKEQERKEQERLSTELKNQFVRMQQTDVSIVSTKYKTAQSIAHDATSGRPSFVDVVDNVVTSGYLPAPIPKPPPPVALAVPKEVSVAHDVTSVLFTSFLVICGMSKFKLVTDEDGKATLDITYNVYPRSGDDVQNALNPLTPREYGFDMVSCEIEKDSELHMMFSRASWNV